MVALMHFVFKRTPNSLANGDAKSGIIELNTAPSPLHNGAVKSGIPELFILKLRNIGCKEWDN